MHLLSKIFSYIFLLIFISGCNAISIKQETQLKAQLISNTKNHKPSMLISIGSGYPAWDELYGKRIGNKEYSTYFDRIGYSYTKEDCLVKISFSGKIEDIEISKKDFCEQLRIKTPDLNFVPAILNGIPTDSYGLLTIDRALENTWDGEKRWFFMALEFNPFSISKSHSKKIMPSTKNPTFSQLDNLKPAFKMVDSEILKGKYETTKEFEFRYNKIQRNKHKKKKKPMIFYVDGGEMLYNADLGVFTKSLNLYAFSRYSTYKVDKIGQNGFGSKWRWTEVKGNQYFLDLKYHKLSSDIGIPLSVNSAKKIKSMNVVLKISVDPQHWKRTHKERKAEYGVELATDYYENHKSAKVLAIYAGDSETGRIYYVDKL